MKDGVIYIYDAKLKEALRTLRHELIDHALTSKVVKPLVEIINLLIKSREAEVYKAKEEVVEKLSRLLQRGDSPQISGASLPAHFLLLPEAL